MNVAYRTTARDLATALLGKHVAKGQTVHVACRTFGRDGPVWPVRALVINEDMPEGVYFAVYRQGTLDALKAGGSTEGLEVWEPNEGEEI